MQPNEAAACMLNARNQSLFNTPDIITKLASKTERGHRRQQRRLYDDTAVTAEFQFLSKASHMVREEEFKGGKRDIHEV